MYVFGLALNQTSVHTLLMYVFALALNQKRCTHSPYVRFFPGSKSKKLYTLTPCTFLVWLLIRKVYTLSLCTFLPWLKIKKGVHTHPMYVFALALNQKRCTHSPYVRFCPGSKSKKVYTLTPCTFLVWLLIRKVHTLTLRTFLPFLAQYNR